jgi:hypothetical protein
MRGYGRWLIAAGVAGMALFAAGALEAQHATTGPKARYEMDVGTTTGFGGMGAMGGGNPMAAMFGGGRGGGGAQHQLTLRLGSTLAPSGGDPNADHFMPEAADLGESVPLVTPVHVSAPEESGSEAPPDFRRPKGRMLIFWGCGAHAGPGQPVIIDFSKLAAGQMPPNLFTADVPIERGPTEANSRTYGEWPNSKSRRAVSAQSSLIGAHRVAGNYSPEINFTLAQDFMAGLNATSQSAPDGSTPMSWNAVPAATGYYAYLFGAQGRGDGDADVVMWSSASRQEFGGGLSDWLAPATVARLIAQHIVMPPSQTSCTVPAEVKQAAGQYMMVQLYAYGPEENFAYPPRPADPRAAWNVEWTAKARYRSTTGMMLGMPGMGGMQGSDNENGDNDDADNSNKPPPPKCKGHGLGGMLKARLGGC